MMTARDPWADLTAIYETWPDEMLEKRQELFRGYLNDPLMQRNQNWLARCIRPNLGLISIILLLRKSK